MDAIRAVNCSAVVQAYVWADYGALHFIVNVEEEQTLRCVFIWQEAVSYTHLRAHET